MNGEKLENMREIWRKDFPWTERLVYFQHAYNSPLPRPAIAEVLNYFIFQSHLGFVQSYSNQNVVEARKNLADVINAKPEEIAFTQSYTEGLNIVTSNIDWKGKNNIVIGEGDYSSTIAHFVNLIKKRKEIELRIIPMDENGILSIERGKELIDGETAIVHLVHVTNCIGTIQPVEEIFDYAYKMGALTIVDAAQSTGIVPHKARDLNCDFYSSVGKKWLMGPVGTAFFWCRENLIEDLEPPIVGKHLIKYDLKDVHLVKTAERFESTTLNHPGIVGLDASIKYWAKIGVDIIEASIKDLIKYLINRLVNDCDAKIVGTMDIEKRTGITSFKLEDLNEREVVKELNDRYFIYTDARELNAPTFETFSGETIRISTHFYNTHGDIDRLIQAIKEIRKARQT